MTTATPPTPPAPSTSTPGWNAHTGYGWARVERPLLRAETDRGERYLTVLGFALLGYAVFGRAFAYLGVPPLFIGEVVLALGLVQLLRVRSLRWMAGQPVVWLLGALMIFTAARTLPFLDRYGIDAPRDAMQVGYALFGFIVAALVADRPARLPELLRRYRTLALVVASVGWVIYLVVKLVGEGLPDLPWASGTKILESKAGEFLVHLAAITTFVYFGFMRRRPWMLFLLALAVGLAVVSSRGGMAAYGLAVITAWMLRPPSARLGRLTYAFAAVLAAGILVGPSIAVNDGTREVSVEQVWKNVTSVFTSSGTSTLDGSRRWRMLWWDKIWDYTVEGPYFWTGKGFGVNLAVDDGFTVLSKPILRSPHNGHLTMLARGGVPGALLWILVHLVWLATVLRAWFAARKAKQAAWMGFFALVAAYWVGAVVNGAFDVYFEGPMGGIWFWTVWGIGLAGAALRARHPDLLDGLLDDATVEDKQAPPPAPPSWGWTPASPTPETPHHHGTLA